MVGHNIYVYTGWTDSREQNSFPHLTGFTSNKQMARRLSCSGQEDNKENLLWIHCGLFLRTSRPCEYISIYIYFFLCFISTTNLSEFGNLCCAVYIVTMLWYGRSSFRIPAGAKNVSFRKEVVQIGSYAPLSLLFKRHRSVIRGLKRPGREINHSPPSRIEFKTDCNSNSTFPVWLCGVDSDSSINTCHYGKQIRFIEQVNGETG